ncbi:MAG: hypothetical protein GXX91_04430 [Verrucomicrobiaceae bacterium]|nr:hypothetical protein [Verrucomicrobiaceae bacterium]
MAVDFTAFGLSGGANLTVNRSAGASRNNGEDFPSQSADEHELHWVDPEYEWFFSAESLPGAAHQFSPPSWHLAASPHIRRLGGVLVGSAPGFELSTGVNSISTRSALVVSNHNPGEGEEEYTVDTGIPIGGESEGTYHLIFQESLDSVWVGLTAQMYNQAWYLAKHGVWVLPFGVIAAASKSSACGVIQDSVYNHLSTTGYDEEVTEIVEEEEYSDVEHIRVEPSGMSALSRFPPVTIQVYHRPPIEATVTPVAYYPTWHDFQFTGI